MNPPFAAFCGIFLFFVLSETGCAEPTPAKLSHPVSKLLSIEVPEKVIGACWTVSRSKDVYSSIGIMFATRHPKKESEFPQTQVWLLKADGTVIPQAIEPSIAGAGNSRGVTFSRSYCYTFSSVREAVAAVISIDGQFVVERLPSNAE